jgi:hypothetical protein
MLAMMLILLTRTQETSAFRAYDCNNQSAQLEQYLLLDQEPWGNMEKVLAIEQELYREIVQMEKERVVQVTGCTAAQTIESFYCIFCCARVKRNKKFQSIVIELAHFKLAAKTGKFKINRKAYPFEMIVRRSVIVNLIGGLNNNGNCEIRLFEVNGMPLRSQLATSEYEIYSQQEWARPNHLTGSIKLLDYLMGSLQIGHWWTRGRAPTSGTTHRMPGSTCW